MTLPAVFNGCSDDESPVEPEDEGGVSVAIAPHSVSVGITETYAFSAVVRGGVANTVDWYVAGVEGGETCTIRIDAEPLGERTAVELSCDDCGFRKFTMEETDDQSNYWTNAISISGCNNAWAGSLRCLERSQWGVLRVEHDHTSLVENCYFVASDGQQQNRGLEVVFQPDGNGTILRNLTVSGFYAGIEFNALQNTLVENCTINGNNYGVNLCCHESPTSQPNPDFGGGARGSLGGNNFSGNLTCGLRNETANLIYAGFNTWDNNPPVEGDDYINLDSSGGGGVITQ